MLEVREDASHVIRKASSALSDGWGSPRELTSCGFIDTLRTVGVTCESWHHTATMSVVRATGPLFARGLKERGRPSPTQSRGPSPRYTAASRHGWVGQRLIYDLSKPSRC